MNLTKYVARRLLFFIPLLFGISILNFILINASGDPVAIILAENPKLTSEDIQILREYYELDKPLVLRYFSWVWKILHLDLGYSFQRGAPVSSLITPWMLQTLKLQIPSAIIALSMAILIGVKLAQKPYSKSNLIVSIFSIFGTAMPYFFMCILLIIYLSYYLPIFPYGGAVSIKRPLFDNWFIDEVWHMILPVAAISFVNLAIFVRLVRTNMIKALHQDYIVAARACGLSERSVVYKHALRNAIIPVVTYLGIWLGICVTNGTVTETVFSWPGLGYLYIQSIQQLDLNVILGINMVVTILVYASMLVTDIFYVILDPRITLE